MTNWRPRVLLEPRGFIRFMQFILSIVAFATTSGFSGILSYSYTCDNKLKQLTFPVSYPFRLDGATQDLVLCNNATKEMQLEGDLSPSAQWFVCVGVFSFLLSLGSMVFYVAFESTYREKYERYITVGDLVATVIFAFLWLTAASAWAWGFNQVKYLTSSDYVGKISPFDEICKLQESNCRPGGAPNFSSISTSVAFGFLNFFLWVSNVWFVYKESPLHPEPNKNIGGETPAAPQNTM